MTLELTDRERRINRFYASGDDYWSALEEPDDEDMDIEDEYPTLWPAPHAIPTNGDRRPQWVDWAAWYLCVLTLFFIGIALFAMLRK